MFWNTVSNLIPLNYHCSILTYTYIFISISISYIHLSLQYYTLHNKPSLIFNVVLALFIKSNLSLVIYHAYTWQVFIMSLRSFIEVKLPRAGIDSLSKVCIGLTLISPVCLTYLLSKYVMFELTKLLILDHHGVYLAKGCRKFPLTFKGMHAFLILKHVHMNLLQSYIHHYSNIKIPLFFIYSFTIFLENGSYFRITVYLHLGKVK